MKHLTILNPNAGHYSVREHEQISSALASLEGKVLATSSLSELELELQQYRDYHPDILGIGGGDGTASRTLTKIQEVWGYLPKYLAVYAMGTMNNVATPLGVSSGFIDKVKQSMGKGKTKPVQLAEYIGKAVSAGEELNTEKIIPLHINDRLGFNLGFGVVSKLVWMYYNRTIDQYRRAERELERCDPREYETLVEQIVSQEGKSGTWQAAKTALQSIVTVFNPSSPLYQFLNQPLNVRLSLDGQCVESIAPLTSIYVASYEQQNVGVFRGKPSPGARAVAGKMEVIISSASPKEIIFSLPAINRGEPMRNTAYVHAQELRLESEQVMMGQVDGELIFGKEFVIRLDKELKCVSLLNH